MGTSVPSKFPSSERVKMLAMYEQMVQAENYLDAINLETAFANVIANKAIAIVANRLKGKHGTTVAPINNAPSLRVGDVSINKWAKWRKPDQDPAAAFTVISTKTTDLIAKRLHLEPAQVTVKVDVDTMKNISRIVFHFAESVTRVPTNQPR